MAVPPPAPGGGGPTGTQAIYIREYRIEGTKILPRDEVEKAIYPFLGPQRTPDDVDGARAALEKAYKDKGYETVAVEVGQQYPQHLARGVVHLKVVEAPIGRLRVKGARYFLPSAIKARAQSMAEGKVINLNEVQRNLAALNQHPDLRVEPDLHPGVEPGTWDIDLKVKDKFPLHGSVELNNQYSADTTELRLNASLSYNNLWQLGHSAGFSMQLSPQAWDEVKVYSGYYMVRFPNVDWFSISLQGTKQDSNVSTLGGVASAGRGETIGARAIFTLPPMKNFIHSLSVGTDYKHYNQLVTLPGAIAVTESPLSYYPMSATYNATWLGKSYLTDLSAGVVFHFRGMGSGPSQFDTSRLKASGDFIYFKGELSHTQDLPGDAKLYAKVHGQIADQPLVTNEEIGGGGLGTVRGYLEAEVLGDNAIFGTIELQSPSLLGWLSKEAKEENEWRVYLFADGGVVTVNSPPPEQTGHFNLASIGFGSRIRLFDHLNGSLDAGLPLTSQTTTRAREALFTFRVWADF